MAIVVWLGYVAARTIAPERLDLRIGVPLLLAFIPQNVFYAMNNDVLSPLCFGVLFLCVLQWLRTDAPSLLLGAVTGVAVASTYLTKLSNLPLIVIALAVILARSWRNCSTKSSCRLDRACSAHFVRRRPDWQLDGLAEIAVWRCHRINGENRVPGLDAKAVR